MESFFILDTNIQKLFKLITIENIMNEHLDEINSELIDRTNVFYWQTDRNISPENAGKIWKDRHKYFNDNEIIELSNNILKGNEISSIDKLNLDSQINLGNVNSVRIGHLNSGEDVIIRNHPRGIENGYFHVESLASSLANKNGIPSYKTFAIHDINSVDDYSFQIIEKLPGIVVKKYLEENPNEEKDILYEVGKTLANIHKINVEGFGPFDNKLAKKGKLKGLHKNAKSALNAGLEFNCKVLYDEKILTSKQISKIKNLFNDNYLLENVEPVLIHNDFADWNLLTQNKKISGVLDFDECVGGDRVMDIACWSTFFSPNRLEGMLDGYFSETKKPNNFEEKFELYRLRYVISKMTLRIRRYNWQPTEFMKSMIEKGSAHLEESLKYFNI